MLSAENRALVVADNGPDGLSVATRYPQSLGRLMDAARAQGIREERERAIAVLRPFADYVTAADPNGDWSDESEIAPFTQRSGLRIAIRYRDLRAASSYITQAQGE